MASPKTVVINFRATPDTVARLDEHAREVGLSRGGLVRALIKTSLGDPAQMALIEEASFTASRVLKHAVARALTEFHPRLAGMIAEEIARQGLDGVPSLEGEVDDMAAE